MRGNFPPDEDEQMITVDVDSSSFIRIIKVLNDHIKKQESRIATLESMVPGFVQRREMEERLDAMGTTLEKFMCEFSQLSDRFETHERLNKENEENMTESIEEKFNEALVASSLKISLMTDSLDSRITKLNDEQKHVSDEIKEQKRMSAGKFSLLTSLSDGLRCLQTDFANHCTESNYSQIASTKNMSEGELHTVTNRITRLEQMLKLDHEANDEFRKRTERNLELLNKPQQPSIVEATKPSEEAQQKEQTESKRDDLISQIKEIWAISNQNHQAILSVMDDVGKLADKIERVEAIKNIPIVIKEESEPAPTTFSFQSQLIPEDNSSNDGKFENAIQDLSERINTSITDVTKLKSTVSSNARGVRDVVLAIIDEFKLIRTNATGLENLPPLNLAKCVPSFFNNPSFTFDREISTASSFDSERYTPQLLSGRKSEPDIIEQEEPQIRKTKMVSGLLHLVYRPDYNREREEVNPIDRDITDLQVSSEIETDFDSDSEILLTPRSLQIKADPINAGELPSSKRQSIPKPRKTTPTVTFKTPTEETETVYVDSPQNRADLKEMQEIYAKFSQDKDDIISIIERKVDRDMVERLFNKFRTIIFNMNNRVHDLAHLSSKCVTRKDVEEMICELAQQQEPNTSIGVIKGPECLVCGRMRQSVADHPLPPLH